MCGAMAGPLMRDRALLTIDIDRVMAQAQDVAQQIDAFLVAREGNLLDKLIAIGGLNQEEMFEVQVKVAIEDPEAIDRALKQPPDFDRALVAAQSIRYVFPV